MSVTFLFRVFMFCSSLILFRFQRSLRVSSVSLFPCRFCFVSTVCLPFPFRFFFASFPFPPFLCRFCFRFLSVSITVSFPFPVNIRNDKATITRVSCNTKYILSMTSQLFHFVPLWAGISERDSRSEAAQVQLRNALNALRSCTSAASERGRKRCNGQKCL